jgi:hypothetical protein
MITSGGKIATEYHAFDCVHIHWRWSQSSLPIKVDPMVEPSDNKSIGVSGRGKPNLVPGQTIQIGIVKVDNNTPRDPDDPLSLIKEPQTIATTYDFTDPRFAASLTTGQVGARPEKTLKSLTDETGNPVSTIVWYVASWNFDAQDDPRRSQKDTFFRHGIFVIDPKTTKAELETICSNLQGLAMLGNEDKKTAVLAQMDNILGSNIWSVDGNMLAGQNGGTVFTALSAAASSLIEVRNKAPQLSERMAISQELGEILSATQHMVNSDLQSRLANTLASAPGQQAMFQKVIAENQAIARSIEKFASTSNGSDIAEAAQIIDGFKQSWFDGVKGISEVATALGISAPTASGVDATTNTAATPTGERTIENGFLTYDNSEYGFSIKYPTTWTKNEIPEGVNFVGASEVFNVWSFKNLPLFENEKKTLDENVKATIDERMKKQSNFRLEESNDIEFNGLPAHKILFTYTDSKSGPTRAMEVILINGNVRYELYFAASTELFAKSLPTAEQMFDSFELVGAGSQSTPTGTTINTPTPVGNNKATTTTGTGQQKQQSANDTSNGDQPSPGQDKSPPQQPAKSHIADMVDYENQDFRLVMKYPTNWVKQENVDNVVFTSPAESQQDKYLESLYVYHEGSIPLFKTADETLKKNVQAVIDFRKSFKNFQLLSNDDVTLHGKPAGQIVYTYTDPSIGDVKAMEIVAVDGSDKYNIVFIANPEQYSTALPVTQKMLDSIQITPEDNQLSTDSNAVANSNTQSEKVAESSSDNIGIDKAQGFNVADETAKIKAEEFQFYNFKINPDIATAQLTGSYEEKDGNDVAVTLYETSSCNAPASSADFDISTCKEIHTETGPSGSLQLPLSPGKYYLNFASPDQSNNLKVNVHFDVVDEG